MALDDIFQTAIRDSLGKLVKAQDEYIIAFFGSEEEAIKQAPLYIFEEETEFIEKGKFIFAFESRYRLRKKTPEELASQEPHVL